LKRSSPRRKSTPARRGSLSDYSSYDSYGYGSPPVRRRKPPFWRRTPFVIGLVAVIAIALVVAAVAVISNGSRPVTTTSTSVAFAGTSTLPPTVVTSTAVPPTPSPPKPLTCSAAGELATSVGQAQPCSGGDPLRLVIFEESHSSPACQTEVAVMLNRLYERHGLRQIGIEGYFAANGNLSTAWLKPSLSLGQGVRENESVLIQRLADGEINSAELMTLIYPDVRVSGLEDASEYSFEPPPDATKAPLIVLARIASASMSPSQNDTANDLIQKNQTRQALEFMISTNEWTKTYYAKIQAPTPITPEDWRKYLEEIGEKALETGADVTPQDFENLHALWQFYDMVSKRSETMSKNTLALAQRFPNAPIAITVGVAHTPEIEANLGGKALPYTVIRCASFSNQPSNGDLHDEALQRKMDNQSVDPAGQLEALLDGRKKPSPVIEERWFQEGVYVRDVIVQLALAAAANAAPPFASALAGLSNEARQIVDQNSIKKDGTDVIFSVALKDKNGAPRTIWIRARADKDRAEMLGKSVEASLMQALRDILSQEKPNNEAQEPSPSNPQRIRISADVVAKISDDKAKIESTNLD
jgi:hypothetical protein